MAGCILFAWGENFKVDTFLESSPWHNLATAFHKGDKATLAKNPPLSYSGFKIYVSPPDDDVGLQIQKATDFLEQNASELQRLKDFLGAEKIELKFGTWLYEDSVAVIVSVPSKLVSLAGQYGIEMTVCVYATRREEMET